jgi:hypothetical protein
MKIILSEYQFKNLIDETLHATIVKNIGAQVYSDKKDEDRDFRNVKDAIDIPLNRLTKNQTDEDEDDFNEKVNDIIKKIKNNKKVDPLVVYKIGKNYKIVDGHHRYGAYQKLNYKTAKCLVIPKENIKFKKKWTKDLEKDYNKEHKKGS